MFTTSISRSTPASSRISDPKIDRIANSWLDGDVEGAEWLASVADEVVVPAGTVVGGGRFAYVLLDADADTGCVFVAHGVAPVVVERATRVLVLAEGELTEAVRRFPVLTDAWAAGVARCGAVVA